jgi:protein-S-isoprenylcysteine O-methyltransferase Ste14
MSRPPREPSVPRDLGPAVAFPPPLLFVALFAIGTVLERWIPLPVRLPDHPVLATLGLLVMAAGVALVLTGIWTFRRARTAVYPNRPAKSLVTHGVYAHTRNPMYVGMSMLYLGGIAATAMLWPVLLFPVVIGLLVTQVIQREERYLRERFAEEYGEYCARVRRWV